MYLDRSTSTVDKTQHYITSPSPLAMTPEEFYTASIQTAELAASYYAERPSKPVYTAPSREVLDMLLYCIALLDGARAVGFDTGADEAGIEGYLDEIERLGGPV